MWKRIVAYIVGIPLTFLGLLYAADWYATRQARLEARKGLAEMTAREDALDSLGDLTLDPAKATLADLERGLHQPSLMLSGMHNTTRVGWACADNACEVWASFSQPFGTKLDPGAIPLSISMLDTAMRKRTHRISIGGIYLGELSSEMLDYGKSHGYGTTVAYHHITWDKGWSLVWAETAGKVSFLMFLNDKLLEAARADTPKAPLGAIH